MDSTTEFLDSLKAAGITDVGLEGGALESTKILLKKADVLWDAATTTGKLAGRMLPGEKIIDPKYISEARLTETFNGKTYSRPIIDLVQQGGGMYGIALVGYTYIMEKAGLRFYSLGGTSAGAINTIMLGALPGSVYQMGSAADETRQATKSELLAHIIANTKFDKFIDRPGWLGKQQGFMIRHFAVVKWILLLAWVATFVTLYKFTGSIFDHNCLECEVRIYDFFIGPITFVTFPVLLYLIAIRVLGKKFGANPGNVFYNWVTKILNHDFVGIFTTKQLQDRMKSDNTFDNKNSDTEAAKILFISSNLTHNRIVKFPQRAVDYWNPSENINPAAYVRASMSIPFVFETFIPSGTDIVGPGNTAIINPARFVDGGMLSNFPIREFHNHTVAQPRFPTFGVLLSERSTPSDFSGVSLGGYIMSFLTTFRNFYDNDFLLSSEEIKMRVELVDTKGFDWLDFWMKDEDKQKLFEKGAEAAIRQLEHFDFEEYKKIRSNEIRQSI